MAEINDLLSNISNIKTDIKSAIENKGQNVTNLASYPNAILNIVSGGSSGIKIFDSIANMQNSSNSSTGDLAVVYNSTIDNITENTQFQEGTFPETVTLTTAVTDYIELQFKAVNESTMFDCWGEISSDRFNMSCYTDDGSGSYKDYRIEYTSSDGLTYTRTRFQINQEDISGNVMDFDTLIVFGSRWGEPTWDDRIGQFIKAGTTLFEGMYRYNGTDYNWANTGLTAISEDVYKGKFYGNNIITTGTGNTITGLNLDQLKDKVNLYSNLSYLTVKNNENLQSLFEYKEDLLRIPNINMININNTSYMFIECHCLDNIPNFDLSNIKNSSRMFYNCYNLTNIPNFNLSNVINVSGMFSNCENLTSIPNFDTSNVTDMSDFLYYCFRLLNIPNFNTSNVINMSNTFRSLQNITNIPNFNTSKVTNMHNTFWGCISLEEIPNFDTSNVTDMADMFGVCYNIHNIPNFNTSKVTNMHNMFSQGSFLTTIPNFDMSNVINASEMFFSCYRITDVPILNLSKVVNITNMFADCSNLSSSAYANITNMLPNASQLTNKYLANIGLNIQKFTNNQKNILFNKGYVDTDYDPNNWSTYYNVYYE